MLPSTEARQGSSLVDERIDILNVTTFWSLESLLSSTLFITAFWKFGFLKKMLASQNQNNTFQFPSWTFHELVSSNGIYLKILCVRCHFQGMKVNVILPVLNVLTIQKRRKIQEKMELSIVIEDASPNESITKGSIA